MQRVSTLLLASLLASPIVAKPADPSPSSAKDLAVPKQEIPSGKEALAPKVVPPKPRKRDPRSPGKGERALPLPPGATGAKRVPLEGRTPGIDPSTPGIDPSRLPKRPSSLPLETPGAEGVRHALTNLLRIDGRTGRVDLRGQDPAVGRVEWQLEGSDRAVIVVTRVASGGCPSSGATLDQADRQLSNDPSVVFWNGWPPAHGSSRTEFARARDGEVTDVYVQACGIGGHAINGVVSNVVRVRTGSVHRTLRSPAPRWSVEWNSDTSSNAACVGRLESTATASPPSGPHVGYRGTVTRGADPFPCVRDTLETFQSTAAFQLSSLPREARIVSAVLRFTETDPERRSASGRLCGAATRDVGLATGRFRAGTHHVDALSGADEMRSVPYDGGSRRALDIADWVRAWQGGRAAAVTFRGGPTLREGAACMARIADVQIFIEFE